MNIAAISSALLAARDRATRLPLPTAHESGFDLADAYVVADEIRRRRIARGEHPLGYKIGFPNRSI